jgi:2-polyprenyl-6-hydroxyphenyl methylase/3-demethylubiquinone-9 3-methyltransferase
MSVDVQQLKQAHKEMWESGDYAALAELITDLSEDLVQTAGISAGMDVLDIGTGTGNAAIAAAQRGARVTGLDLAPELLRRARDKAAEAGVEVEWVDGDAEALPFDDASFDAVISAIGHMFAPRHREAANELLRVCKSGGTIPFCAWTPEGLVGRIFAVQARYLPPPPDYASSPILWGSEEHVREMIGDGVSDLKMDRRNVTIEHDSPESWFAYFAERFGPLVTARAALEPQGRWEEFAREMTAVFADANEADEGFRFKQEYLRVVATRS